MWESRVRVPEGEQLARVVELVDTHGLGPCSERCESSSLSSCTNSQVAELVDAASKGRLGIMALNTNQYRFESCPDYKKRFDELKKYPYL